MTELFPQIKRVEPPPKIRKPRKKLHNFSKEQNRSRYYRHRKIKQEKAPVLLEPKLLKMQCELGFDIERYKHIKALIKKFGYTIEAKPFFTPPPILIHIYHD